MPTAWYMLLLDSGSDRGENRSRRRAMFVSGNFFAHKPSDHNGSPGLKNENKNRRKTVKNQRFSAENGRSAGTRTPGLLLPNGQTGFFVLICSHFSCLLLDFSYSLTVLYQVVSEKQAYLCLTRYKQRKSLTAQRDRLSFAALVSDKRRFNFFIKQKSILLRSSERITVYFAFPVTPQLFQIKFRKIDLFRSIRL